MLPTYLSSLEALAQQPSSHQHVFAGLAAQGCMLAGLVAVLQALAYAQCGQKQEALRYLGLAHETFPEQPEADPGFSFADCGPSSLSHYGGLIFLTFDQPKKAWEAFESVNALKTTFVIPEWTLIEIVNCQAEAAIAQRDLELAHAHIQVGIAGALRLKSEMRFNETVSIYKQMKLIWPQEARVKALAIHFQR